MQSLLWQGLLLIEIVVTAWYILIDFDDKFFNELLKNSIG